MSGISTSKDRWLAQPINEGGQIPAATEMLGKVQRRAILRRSVGRGQSRSMLYGWKENSMLTNCLGACAHLTITVSEIQRDICEKIDILS